MKDNEIPHLNILVRFSKILLRFLKICCEGERGASDQNHEKQLSPIHSKIFWTFQKSNLDSQNSKNRQIWAILCKSSDVYSINTLHLHDGIAGNRIVFIVLSFVSVNILFLWHFKMHTAFNYTIDPKLVKTVGQG